MIACNIHELKCKDDEHFKRQNFIFTFKKQHITLEGFFPSYNVAGDAFYMR